MMAAKLSLACLPRLLLALLLLFCLGEVFYTYFKPAISGWSRIGVAESEFEVNTDVFSETFTRNLSCTFNYTVVKQQIDDTIILIWKWPFGYTFHGKSCGPTFGIEGCQFTNDRSLYDKAHGVMFHHRETAGDFRSLRNRPRPPHQKWVWMNMESPDNSKRLAEIGDLFNLTSNYRRDSDVWVPYGRILPVSEIDKPFEMPSKDKLVCWIVSNWNYNYRRVKYFNELRKYIEVHTYGKHFNRYIKKQDYVSILSGCKFYLSFESSSHKDYITEKLFNPMSVGTVPVVLGPPRENYEEFIPSDSFIHVDDYKSPRELAEHLKYLDRNQEMYEQYFRWRQHFTARGSHFGLEHACLICDHIKKHKGYRVFKDLNTWYWG